MPYGTRAAIASVIMVASMLFGSFAGSSAAALNGDEPVRANPHNYAKKELCSLCHKGEPSTKTGVDIQTGTAMLHFDQITTCAKCHEANLRDHPISRHPIGKAPMINMPGKLPLGDKGQIVCHTCHDPHNRSGNAKMLRVSLQELCASCHVGY